MTTDTVLRIEIRLADEDGPFECFDYDDAAMALASVQRQLYKGETEGDVYYNHRVVGEFAVEYPEEEANDTCMNCDGYGWVKVALQEPNHYMVESCESCERYRNDADAREAHRAYIREQLGWSEESDDEDE